MGRRKRQHPLPPRLRSQLMASAPLYRYVLGHKYLLGRATILLSALFFAVSAVAANDSGNDYGNEPTQDQLSAEDILSLKTGEVVSRIWRDRSQSGSVFEAFAAVDIQASSAEIWDVMTDCAKSVEVVADMKSCTVLSGRVSDGSDVREQTFRTPFPFPSFRTIIQSDYILHQQIKVQKAGGDMKVQDALWLITPLESGDHRVTYKARIGLNMPIPRFMIKEAIKKDTPKLLINLREAAESGQRGG